ncbi:putative guanylate cyclase [Trypanosoma theileri]|uniref:Putative guanylate cyclase n=1 Tax=Trypanosoma theileri TaxID=67003 RepID=A0A1X0P0U5_9TRYP|nr:putative guanylate cyclase [Trypanosoma theileri]ORC90333.1 putative guanylate cyclase [Trypanosoma theileri]
MLVSQRIAALQRLQLRLRRATGDKQQQQQHYGDTVQQKLLFRHIPIALSLLERSLLPILGTGKTRQSTSTMENKYIPLFNKFESLSTLTKGSEQQSLSSNNVVLSYDSSDMVQRPETNSAAVEYITSNSSYSLQQVQKQTQQQRKHILGYPSQMLHLFSSLHFLEQERRKLYRHHLNRLESKLLVSEKELHSQQKRRQDATVLAAARQSVSEVKADIELLRDSLLSRSYISARLWRFLLREEIWLSALMESQEKKKDTYGSSIGVGNTKSVLLMLLSLTRISLGVLQDVLQGHSLNTRAPRFVASLPSRKIRHGVKSHTSLKDTEKQQKKDDDDGVLTNAVIKPTTHVEDNEVDDMMAMMMMMTETTTTTETMTSSVKDTIPKDKDNEKEEKSLSSSLITSKTGVKNKNEKAALMRLRWLPPSSCDAIPLVLETLAMCSHVLSALDNHNTLLLLSNLEEATELFELLSVLQTTASLLLALPVDEHSSEVTLHRTLHHLEDTMLKCANSAKEALITQMNGEMEPLPPVKAARLLLGLNSMQLIHTEERVSQQLLTQFVLQIFPQLSTGTQRALLEKSRQNSLFAFATRGQRAKLYRDHSRQEVESTLLNSVRVRARLQQRQMQAALRTKYLESVNNRSVGQLADSLPVYSLISLLHLLARTANDTERRMEVVDAQGRLITAALFVAEAIMIAGAHRSSSSSTDENASLMLLPSDLPPLLSALSVLWQLSSERYQLMRHSNNSHNIRQSKRMKQEIMSDSVAKSEFIMVSYITEVVFNAVNAAISERVERAEAEAEVVMSVAKGKEMDGNHLLSLKDMIAVIAALSEWCDLPPNKKSTANVETSARLIKRLLISDVQLWSELRGLSESRREAFLSTLRDVMRRSNMMDAVVSKALSAIC